MTQHNQEESQAKHSKVTTKNLQFELRCNSLDRDKIDLLVVSTHKELKKEVTSTSSAYLESEDFTKVKVHSFLEGFWYDEITLAF